jgi:hypothetical protein
MKKFLIVVGIMVAGAALGFFYGDLLGILFGIKDTI